MENIILIKLEKITRNGNIISALITIMQTHPETFTIEVDVVEQRIVNCSRDNLTDMYVIQALAKIIKLSEESGDYLPQSTISAWY